MNTFLFFMVLGLPYSWWQDQVYPDMIMYDIYIDYAGGVAIVTTIAILIDKLDKYLYT